MAPSVDRNVDSGLRGGTVDDADAPDGLYPIRPGRGAQLVDNRFLAGRIHRRQLDLEQLVVRQGLSDFGQYRFGNAVRADGDNRFAVVRQTA